MSVRSFSWSLSYEIDVKVWQEQDGFYTAIAAATNPGHHHSISASARSRSPFKAAGSALVELGEEIAK